MTNIEDRVVAMSFENSKFESGVRGTINTLDRLNAALKNAGSGKGLTGINDSASRVNLSHIGSALDAIKGKMGALNVAAVAIFTNIALKAASAAARMIKAFTITPILDGFHNYETQINAVQTILANTGLTGKKGLDKVNGALKELNDYANKTVYNFSEMAKNIGTFTAAGVDLKTATASIKGIANLAALSGSNSQQASTAMYQLSQAIASGQVHLQDWNSVVNAGMGGTVFQRALALTAEKMGTLKDGSVKLVGAMKNVSINGQSFRQALQVGPGKKSWLTSGVLTTALKEFTGDMSNAQLKAIGFNKEQIKAIQQQAKTAVGAATHIKTMTQLMQALHEEVATAWGAVFKTIFGNINQATKLFSPLHTAIQNALTRPINSLNKVLEQWSKLGGRTVLIEALKSGFHDLSLIMQRVSDAFRDIFPAKTGKDLYNATVGFKHLMDSLKPSDKTLVNLTKTFRGFFALLDIGKQIVGGFFGVIGDLLGKVGKSSGGFLDFTGNIGDWLTRVDEALKKGQNLTHFFNGLEKVIQAPFKALGYLKTALVALFTGVDPSKVTQGLGSFKDHLSPLGKLADFARRAWDKFIQTLGKVHDALKPVMDSIKQAFSNLGPTIANAVQNINFDQAMKVLVVGLLASFVYTFKKFATGGFDNVIGKGLLASITGSFKGLGYAFGGLGKALHGLGGLLNGLTGNLEAMQQRTKAQALKEIAIALALLAASALALSFIPEKKLQSAMGGLAIGLGELVGAMALLNGIGKGLGFLKLPILAAGLIALAGAVDVLTVSVVALSFLKWENLSKGLLGVGVLLGGLVLAAKPLASSSLGLVVAGVGLNAIAVAMNILSLAVNTLGSMDLGKLGKGIGSIGASLVVIGGAVRIFPTGTIAIGIGLNAIATALILISKSVEKFGSFNWGVIVKGLAGIGGSLLVIGGAMRLMPNGMIKQAIALGILGIALQGIAHSLSDFGGMSLGEMAKGLVTMAGALVILAIALDHMKGTMRGAAALSIAALGLRLLAPALKTLGGMSWADIGKGMITLAAAIALLGVAGLALEPVAPALLAFGVALLAIGAGMALAGAGVALLGTGLSAVAVAGPAAVKILVDAVVQLAAAIPKVAKDVVMGLLAIVQQIAKVAPQFAAAMITIGKQMISALIKLAPEVAKAITALIKALIEVLDKNAGPLIQAGFKLLKDILQGIERNIGGVVKTVGNIIIKFLNALANKTPQIITAGATVLIKFLQGMANNIGRIVSTVGTMIAKFIGAIGNNINKVITAGASLIINIVKGISNNLGRIITAGTDALIHFVTGVSNNIKKVVNKGTEMAAKFLNAVVDGVLKLVNVGANAVIKFLNGIAQALRTKGPQIIQAGANLAASLIEGIISGLASLPGILVGKIGDLIKEAVSSLLNDELPAKFQQFFKAHPKAAAAAKTAGYRVGTSMGEGLKQGTSETITNWGTSVEGQLISSFKSATRKAVSQTPVPLSLTRFLNQGFLDGINGVETTTDRVTQTVQSMSQKLQDAIISTNAQIKSETNHVNSLTSANKGYSDQITKAVTQRVKLQNQLKTLEAGESSLTGKKKKARDDEIKSLKDKITSEKDLITTLKERRSANDATIESENAQIAANKALVDSLSGARIELTKNLVKEKNNLILLSAAYDDNKQKLEDANGVLKDAINLRDDFAKSTTDSFEGLPSLLDPTDKANAGADFVGDYVKKLQDQADATQHFSETLQKLKDLGLDDMTYRKLLSDGIVDAKFADQLLGGGQTAVDNINAIDTKIATAASALGTDAAGHLYQAGVDAAQGIVNGLNSQHDQIVAAMNKIAADMVAALKKKLKIKSPSQEFAKIGDFSTRGLAEGLRNSSSAVTNAAVAVGDEALSAMRTTMSRLSDVMNDTIETDPTIRPVLDLSSFNKSAQKMTGLTTDLSADHALTINAAQIDMSAASADSLSPEPKVVQFNQTNNSPKALSEVEIYRQTRNQLSQAKSALGLR